MAHTPGPWQVHTPRIEAYGPGHQSVIAPAPTKEATVLICELNTTVRNPWLPPQDALADARLIAAAPELLAACEVALKRLEEVPGVPSQMRMAAMNACRTALGQAKGE